MEKQYCKVGSTTSVTNLSQASTILESRYHNFIQKAANFSESNPELVEFFKYKAQNIRKTLDALV